MSCLCRKNGRHLGVAFKNVCSVPLYPIIGLHRYGSLMRPYVPRFTASAQPGCIVHCICAAIFSVESKSRAYWSVPAAQAAGDLYRANHSLMAAAAKALEPLT